jgi:hypothetical protein
MRWCVYEDIDKREPIVGWNNEITKVRKFVGFVPDDDKEKLPPGNWVLRSDRYTERWVEIITYPFVKCGFYSVTMRERLEALWKGEAYTAWSIFDALPEEKIMPIKKSSSADPVSEAMKVFKSE